MSADVLLGQSVDDTVDATRIDVLGSRLRLKHILTEKVVLSGHDAIVLNVKNLLREMLAFSV